MAASDGGAGGHRTDVQVIKECDGGSLRDKEGDGTAVNGEDGYELLRKREKTQEGSNEDE